jgi:hypothetical protein
METSYDTSPAVPHLDIALQCSRNGGKFRLAGVVKRGLFGASLEGVVTDVAGSDIKGVAGVDSAAPGIGRNLNFRFRASPMGVAQPGYRLVLLSIKDYLRIHNTFLHMFIQG